MTLAIIIISILVVALAIALITSKVLKVKVQKHSTYLKELRSLKSKYKFFIISSYSEKKVNYCNSKRQFDNFDYYAHFKTYVANNYEHYLNISNSIMKNQELYASYFSELKKIRNTSNIELIKECNMATSTFIRIEKKLGQEYIVKKPENNYVININAQYTSPAGRNHYTYTQTFNLAEIRKVLIIVRDVIEGRHNPSIKQRATSKTIPTYAPKQGKRIESIDDLEEID